MTLYIKDICPDAYEMLITGNFTEADSLLEKVEKTQTETLEMLDRIVTTHKIMLVKTAAYRTALQCMMSNNETAT